MIGTLLEFGEARRFTLNTLREVNVLGRPLMLKSMPNHREARAEAHGHQQLRGHYPIPRLYARLRLPTRSLMVYERWGTGSKPQVLLDLLSQGDDTGLHDYMAELTQSYKSAILSTADQAPGQQLVGKLYRDRAAPGGRLDHYYHDQTFEVGGVRVEELRDYTLIVNGRPRTLDWVQTLNWLQRWAADATPQWSAITQGDPTDVNLAVPFALFDYDTAGRNALCGEFANFCWYTGFLGGYLVPRRNPAAFTRSPEVFAQIPANAPDLRSFTADKSSRRLKIDLTWRPSPARLTANQIYWQDVVEPVWSRLAGAQDINRAIRPYLALRILGVYNIADLAPADRFALMVCLAECLADDFDARRLFTQGLM